MGVFSNEMSGEPPYTAGAGDLRLKRLSLSLFWSSPVQEPKLVENLENLW